MKTLQLFIITLLLLIFSINNSYAQIDSDCDLVYTKRLTSTNTMKYIKNDTVKTLYFYEILEMIRYKNLAIYGLFFTGTMLLCKEVYEQTFDIRKDVKKAMLKIINGITSHMLSMYVND